MTAGVPVATILGSLALRQRGKPTNDITMAAAASSEPITTDPDLIRTRQTKEQTAILDPKYRHIQAHLFHEWYHECLIRLGKGIGIIHRE